MAKYYKEINGEVVYSTCKCLKTVKTIKGRDYKCNIINPTEKQILADGWMKVTEPEPSDEEKLQKAKLDKIAQIDNYDSSENVESFDINGNSMWLGHELRQQIRTSAEAYSALGHDTMTKVFNGLEFTFTIPEWFGMLNQLEVYAAEVLNTTERHKAAVSVMDNIQDVIDYDYTTNYPLKLAFGQNDSQDGAV